MPFKTVKIEDKARFISSGRHYQWEKKEKKEQFIKHLLENNIKNIRKKENKSQELIWHLWRGRNLKLDAVLELSISSS